MGKLAVSLGSLPILAFEVEEAPVRIGRSVDNDIVLPLPDIADHHAELFPAGGRCTVRALSGEQLRCRGRSVAEATLGSGDRVGLGGYELEWIGEGDSSGEGAPETVLGRARSHGTKPLEAADAGLRPATVLEVVAGPDSGSTLVLTAAISTVGRSPECDLCLTDESVSWRHCCLELTREGIRVRDLGSRNGTFLDGRRVETALAGAGNTVQLGASVLELGGGEKDTAPRTAGLAELVGESPAMRSVYAQIQEAAATTLPVLISGETGTGKELVARAIHSIGPRASGPFVPINCAAIPREMLEDELFGHVKGAFTGATADRQGAFERAHGGTILLDEVGELPPELQAKLLRVLEDGVIPRLGGEAVSSDFRIVAATNRELAASGDVFRQDLFFRLAVMEVQVPPLRDRPGDVPLLVEHFLTLAQELDGLDGARGLELGGEALALLDRHDWPGNVRELRNVVLRLAVAAKTQAVDAALVERLLAQARPRPGAPASQLATLEETERDVIRRTLEDCGGQKRATARRLGIAESTLYDKIRRYGLR